VAFQDLRDYLQALEHEGQLIRFTDEILPEPDIRAISRGTVDMGPNCPGVLIENIKGYKGKRVAVNLHGGWANHAVMLGMEKTTSLKEQFQELARRWDNYDQGQIEWYQGNAPCREVVITENINLYEIIPLYRVNPYDGGFYLSKASIVTKDIEDPDNFDKVNLGTYRVQVQGPDTLGLQGLAFHDISIHAGKAESRNEPLPICICLGVDPILTFIASTPIGYDQSEYKFASALSGEPKILTRGITNDLPIPFGAEYVIEGEIIPRVRVPEGPFGEFPGSYSGIRSQYQIKVKAVTHRKDPIFENLYLGRPWTEIDTLMGLNTSIPLYKQLRETMPEVTTVNAMYQHGLTAIIAADNRLGGYAKSVAMRLASTPHGIAYCKNIIVVDGDMDPFDLNQVMWALSTRVRPDKDIIVIPHTPGMPLDPASEPPGMSGKVIIDATTPVSPEPVLREVRMVDQIEKSEYYKKVLENLYNKGK
jgi:4-hydroxybenzoate decarboxylase